MPNRRPMRIALLAVISLCLPTLSARTRTARPRHRRPGRRPCGELARAITLEPAPAGTKSELISEPIFRFDDPARRFSDGTIWAFGKSGRPDALLCLSLEKDDRGQLKWIHELTSLSSGTVAASSRHGSGPWTWNPNEAGIVLQPIPKGQPPADDEGKRLRQMRETARRFKASESLDPARNDPSDRFELRHLPQPILRYQNPDAGLVDGAIFLMAYGRNPEIALLIEARREDQGEPAWFYGLARIGAARLRVNSTTEKSPTSPSRSSRDGGIRIFCSTGRHSAGWIDRAAPIEE